MRIFAASRNTEDESIDKPVGVKHFFRGPKFASAEKWRNVDMDALWIVLLDFQYVAMTL
jgi:hypothetical protein